MSRQAHPIKMRCFNHSDIDAIGTCKVCQKGLCRACAVDMGHSLSCQGEHEGLAEAVNDMVQRSLSVQKVAGRSKYVAPTFFSFMGAIFLIFGLQEPRIGLGVYLGVGFVVFGVAVLAINLRAYSGTRRGT